MAQTDVEKLVVSIEARTADFERQLRRLESKTDTSMRNSARAVNRLDRSLKTATASAANFMANFARGAGAAALAALPYTMGQAISSVAELGNAANRAGVSAEGLQVFRRALEQNGATARDADEAMRRLTRRLGEFANSGGGPAKAAIEGLRLEVFNLDGTLRNAEDILADIADRFASIESPAMQAAFAAQLFGDDAGPRLVPLLGQGSQALAGFRQDLQDTGALIRDDAVQAAIEMEDAYNRLMDNVAARWQRGVVEIAGYARDLISITQEATRSAVDSLNAAFDASRSPEDRLRGALGNYEFQSRNGLETGAANFFDRSSFRMPGVSDDTQAPIVDPRHTRAVEQLRGQLAATEQTAQRVSGAFAHFETAGTQAARSVGGAVREAAGEPMNLLQDQLVYANDNAMVLQNTISDLAQGIVSDVNSALSDGKVTWEEWAQIGLSAIERILGSLGQFNQFGGSGGGGFLSSLIGGLFGGGGGAANLFGPGTSMPIYHSGTNYVPQTGPAILQKGEAVIPASMNKGGGRVGGVHVTVGVSDDGNLRAFVENTSGAVSAQVVQAASPGIVDRSVASTGGAIRQGRMDGPMARRYGLGKTARPR